MLKSFATWALACTSLLFITSAVYATPPTPDAQLLIPEAVEFAELKRDNAAITVPARIRVNQDIAKLALLVSIIREGELGRSAEQTTDRSFGELKQGKTQSVQISVPIQKEDGVYRIEAALRLERNGQTGKVDRVILYQIVEQGQARLVTPTEWRQQQVAQRQLAFEKSLASEPKRPDLGLLMNSTIAVPDNFLDNIKSASGKMQSARPAGLAGAIKPYVIDKTNNSDASGNDISRKSAATEGQAAPPLFSASGQLVFEDWYTDSLGNPVFTPLSNATIVVFVNVALQGYLAIVGFTVTDENGNWSASIDPAYQGNDVYYSVALANDSLNVHDASGVDYLWLSTTRPVEPIVDFGQETLTSDVEAAWIFSILNRGWNHIVTVGGQDPGHVEVLYPIALTSHWDVTDERLEIKAGEEAIPDLVLHEYGHALMHYAFGGVLISPGGAHSWNDGYQDTGLAYSEGWAHAFALSVCPDGQFTEDEGPDEGPGDWPVCTNAVQPDMGVSIEQFPDAVNRVGDQNEGRVAAALNDLLDAPNDSSVIGGVANDNIGRSTRQDSNVNDRISLATIYRDHMWGFVHYDFESFYDTLLGDLSGTTKTNTSDILLYNWMGTLFGPLLCVATKVAMAMSSDYAATLDGLRVFRDKVLNPLSVGRHWTQAYYSHSPELAILLIASPDARQAAQVVIEHFARIGHSLEEQNGLQKLADDQASALPPRVINAVGKITKVIEARGSKELNQQLSEALAFLHRFHPLSVSEAVQYVSTLEKAGDGKTLMLLQPMKFAPGSRQVDWELIRKNVPTAELPSGR